MNEDNEREDDSPEPQAPTFITEEEALARMNAEYPRLIKEQREAMERGYQEGREISLVFYGPSEAGAGMSEEDARRLAEQWAKARYNHSKTLRGRLRRYVASARDFASDYILLLSAVVKELRAGSTPWRRLLFAPRRGACSGPPTPRTCSRCAPPR